MKRALSFQPVPVDIVFCKFPEALEATCPGPKIRPALVVDVSKEPPADADTRHSGTSIVRGTLNV